MVIKGNLIDLAEAGMFDVIIHGCNCFHTMGAGIAKEITTRYPDAYLVDRLHTKKGDRSKLGGYTYTTVTTPNESQFTIINAYTQYYYGRPKKGKGPLADYIAIDSVFKMIAESYKDLRIGYPKIGAGLAGGDWNIIQNIINLALSGCDHKLVVL
jgi:O-acetyl-ADP-ribose deacetylase (regulator of RNase III)